MVYDINMRKVVRRCLLPIAHHNHRGSKILGLEVAGNSGKHTAAMTKVEGQTTAAEEKKASSAALPRILFWSHEYLGSFDLAPKSKSQEEKTGDLLMWGLPLLGHCFTPWQIQRTIHFKILPEMNPVDLVETKPVMSV